MEFEKGAFLTRRQTGADGFLGRVVTQAVIFFQDRTEGSAQIVSQKALNQFFRKVRPLDAEGLAIPQTGPTNLEKPRTGRKVESLGHFGGCFDLIRLKKAGLRAESPALHVVGERNEGGQLVAGAFFGDKGAPPFFPVNEAFLLQKAQGLADGGAADMVVFGKLVFRRKVEGLAFFVGFLNGLAEFTRQLVVGGNRALFVDGNQAQGL